MKTPKHKNSKDSLSLTRIFAECFSATPYKTRQRVEPQSNLSNIKPSVYPRSIGRKNRVSTNQRPDLFRSAFFHFYRPQRYSEIAWIDPRQRALHFPSSFPVASRMTITPTTTTFPSRERVHVCFPYGRPNVTVSPRVQLLSRDQYVLDTPDDPDDSATLREPFTGVTIPLTTTQTHKHTHNTRARTGHPYFTCFFFFFSFSVCFLPTVSLNSSGVSVEGEK